MKNLYTKLFEFITYDKESGIFIYTKSRGCKKKNSIAGSLNQDGYIHIKIRGKIYKAHRLAWVYEHGELELPYIDHINGNKSDNRISNLRNVTHLDNHKNQPLRADNTSGFIGVYWHSRDKVWNAGIQGNGKQIHLGNFNDIVDAICARRDAEEEYKYHENHGKRRTHEVII